MVESLAALLAGTFDYAGLFPPAGLAMDAAVREYSKHRSGPEEWMLGRFVVPIARLEELRESTLGMPNPPTQDSPWPLTVLGTTPEQFKQDLATLENFELRAMGAFEVEGYEVRITDTSISPRILASIANAGFDDAFVELPWQINQLEVMDALAEIEVVGAKVRTGGVDADAFPSPDAVASFLQECVNLDLQFKLTAGLHHAVRGHQPSINGTMHGFLNVVVAGALAEVHDLSRQEISRVLSEEDATAFTFSDAELGWRDWQVSTEEARDFRDLFAAIGSCSIQEPIDDLRALGLW